MARFGKALGPVALAGGACVVVAGALYIAVSDRSGRSEGEIIVLPAVTRPERAPSPTEEAAAPSGDATVPEVGGETPIGGADTAASEAPADAPTDEYAAPENTPVEASEPQPEAGAGDQPLSGDVAQTPPAILPTFDLVRAEADGQVLVAGKAAPRHGLRLLVDGKEAAMGETDGGGSFVLFASLDTVDRPRVLDLVSIAPDGTEHRAEESVILAPPAVAEPEPPMAEGAPEPESPEPVDTAELAAPEPEVTASVEITAAPPSATVPSAVVSSNSIGAAAPREDDAPVLGAAPVAPASTVDAAGVADASNVPAAGEAAIPSAPVSDVAIAATDVESGAATASAAAASVTAPNAASDSAQAAPAADVAAAPAVLRANASGVSLLQPSALQSPRLDRVVIDVISYDADGVVTLEGRSAAPPPPIDRVRIYLDNAPIDTAPILDDGTWRLPLNDVESGVYTLRVDQLDTAGNVVSRFETPFKREDPTDLARLDAERPEVDGVLDVSVITVQPGYTLWGIASDRYGDGFQYVAIFDANAGQIRDPDLIYPGQVFDLPEIDAPQ